MRHKHEKSGLGSKIIVYIVSSQALLTLGGGILNLTGGPWSCGSWRRIAPPASPSYENTPAGSQLCGGRTPAGPAAAGGASLSAAPYISAAPSADCESLWSIREMQMS